MKKYASYACILAAAACWGCIGLFNRPLLNAGIAPENLVVIRNLGGLAVLAFFFLCTDRSVFKMKAKHLPIFIATGIISVVLFTLCYFNAQKLCSLSVSAILLYTSPAMVVLMSALVFKEKITGKKLLALALALLGCALVTGVFTGGLSLTTKGLLFGLGAAFFYALYSIFAPFGLRHYSPLAVVFWTFVFAALGASKQYYVFDVPVAENLDLKKAAKAVGEKSIEMLHQKELLPLTGYVHGGCSPVGMKKLFPTVFHETAENLETMIVSAGKIGYQVELAPHDLAALVRAKFADIIVE